MSNDTQNGNSPAVSSIPAQPTTPPKPNNLSGGQDPIDFGDDRAQPDPETHTATSPVIAEIVA